MSRSRKKQIQRSLFAALLLIIVAGAGFGGSCSSGDSEEASSRAFEIDAREQLIGGPTALGEVGDYMLENGKIRLVVQKRGYNRGTGVFGGSLIDADIVRPQNEGDVLGGNGRDTFGEMFPAFFFEMIDPEAITVVNDGSDGEAAIIEVSGRGGEFVSMLRYLNQLLINSYPVSLADVIQGKPSSSDGTPLVSFKTRYILEPGASHVRIESTMQNISFDRLTFPNEQIVSALASFVGLDLAGLRLPAGHVVGFGKLSKIFVPGIGYDLEFGLQDAFAENPVTLPAFPGVVTPLIASSSTEGVSYGFATEYKPENNFVYQKDQQGDFYGGDNEGDESLLLFYASGFGGIFTHEISDALRPAFCDGVSSGADPAQVCEDYVGTCGSGDEVCEAQIANCQLSLPKCDEDWAELPSSYTYTNYFIVGDGDVASIWEEYYDIQDVETRLVGGRVRDEVSGTPVGAQTNVLFYGRNGSSCDDSTIQNQVFTNTEGYFKLELPEGPFCYRVYRSGHPLGELVPYDVGSGETIQAVAPSAGELLVKVVDGSGQPLPSKVTAVGVHEYRDGEEAREFLFDQESGQSWRSTDFVPDLADDPSTRRYIEGTSFAGADGSATLKVRPGTYTITISRGPEYELFQKEVTVEAGATRRVQATVEKIIDTDGWVSGDFHMHAAGSIDSGLDNDIRVRTVAAEGLDSVVSTDHNYVTDYQPYVLRNDLQDWMSSIIGLELTTFEGGHFNAFPVDFVPERMNRGSIPWQDIPPDQIFTELRGMAPDGQDNIIQVNHPRTPILGYFEQHNVDPFSTSVDLPVNVDGGLNSIAAPSGPAFIEEYENDQGQTRYRTTFSWDFDAIEVFNGKHFEELRHFRMPYDKTVANDLPENVYENLRQLYLIELTGDDVVDELADFSGQTEDEVEALSAAERRQLENQYIVGQLEDAEYSEVEQRPDAEVTAAADEWVASQIPDKNDILCSEDDIVFSGALDDWYNLLNYARPDGTYKTYTATGNSDSHSDYLDETGYPRNYYYVGHDDPGQITDQQLVSAMQTHRNVVTNGPFATITINGEPIGSQLNASGEVDVEVFIAAPPWIGADRFRIVKNGESVLGISPDQSDDYWGWVPVELSADHTYRKTFTIDVTEDAWFVLEVEGDQNMFPVVSPQDIPPFNFDAVIGSLAGAFGFGGGVEGLEPQLVFPIRGFAFTNPIWVIADGDGTFDPPNPPVQRCVDGVYGAEENELGDWESYQRLETGRLKRSVVPTDFHQHTPLDRPRGEKRDIRAIFEIFGGHNH